MVLVATTTATIILAIVLTIQKKWDLVNKLGKKEWHYFALLGLLNPVAYYLVLFKAYDLLPAHVAQPINYTYRTEDSYCQIPRTSNLIGWCRFDFYEWKPR